MATSKIKFTQGPWKDAMELPPIKIDKGFSPQPPKGNKAVKFTEHKKDIMKDLGLGEKGKAKPKSSRTPSNLGNKAPRAKGSLKKHTGKATVKLHNRHGN